MKQPLRVLQGIVANDKGGLTGYICQNYRCIDKSKVQFDFVTYDNALDFEEEFKQKGAKFYRLPRASHVFSYFRAMSKLQKEMHYEIVHYNMSYANIIPLVIAKAVGIKKVILHSHSTQIDSQNSIIRKIKECLHKVFKNVIPFVADDYYACSTEAAEWMFPRSIIKNKKFQLCHNAIDTAKFTYDEIKRKKKRAELGIAENDFVVGHIGRFTYQKNHEFLVRVFSEVQKYRPDATLLLVGTGELENSIKNLTDSLLLRNVNFLGQRDDIPELLQVMDAFVLPSRFEGLAIVGIEAQSSGLPCFFSDAITREIGITDLSNFIKLEEPENWAKRIMEIACSRKRENMAESVKNAGYDIKHEIKLMEIRYLKIRGNVL